MWKRQTIIVHWLSAFLIIGTIVAVKTTQGVKLSERIGAMQIHAIFGVIITGLVFARLYYKVKYRKTNPKSNILANTFHLGIYALLIVIGISGIGIGIKGGFFEYLFTGSGRPMRSIFGWVHHNIAGFIIPVIILHVLAVIFHLFKKNDHSFARMMGKKIQDDS